MEEEPMYIVSSCLAGIQCRYDGSHCANGVVKKLVETGEALPLCPEVLGGLPIPRKPCEIIQKEGGQRVISKDGRDVTEYFVKGADKVVKIAKILGVKKVILQSRSPSCGFGQIYDGTFSGKLISGKGITAQRLIEKGISIYNENNIGNQKNL